MEINVLLLLAIYSYIRLQQKTKKEKLRKHRAGSVQRQIQKVFLGDQRRLVRQIFKIDINYVIYTMDQEGQARTRESIQENSWSDQNLTYYFSKFQLFEDHEQINQFYLYSLFLEKVSNELGREWRQEANVLCSPYINSRQIFMNLLSIWLHIHPVVNRVVDQSEFKTKIPVFNQSYTDEFVKRIQSLYQERRKKQDPCQIVIKSTSAKAISMGFFLTANQIWEQMLTTTKKVQKKQSWVLSSVEKTLEQSFKPLMVVTQKISHLFGRKRVKRNDENQQNSMEQEEMFGNCYMDFRRSIDLQKQIERKMSDFCLEEEDDKKQFELKGKKQIITRNQFREEESPLEKNMLGSLYQYVTKFIRKKSTWQVASSFVTNILDINHHNQMEDGTKVKVLRPAEDFYEKLLISWIMLTQQDNKEISYDKYLESVKIAFGRAWRSKYIVPTRYFYDRLAKHWKQIQKEVMDVKLDKKELMRILIKKIRDSMAQDWERKIKMQKKSRKKEPENQTDE